MRNDLTSPTPFTLVSASFQGWLEPNHLFQICSPSGFLVHQPASLTKEGRNVSNLPFPQSSWIGKKLNSMNLEFFTISEHLLFHNSSLFAAVTQFRTNPADPGGWCVTPWAVSPNLPGYRHQVGPTRGWLWDSSGSYSSPPLTPVVN